MFVKIKRISSDKNGLRFELEESYNGKLTAVAISPALGDVSPILEREADVDGDEFELDYALPYGKDMFLRWFLTDDKKDIELLTPEIINTGNAQFGKQYAEVVGDSLENYDYPIADTKKGLQVTMVEDAVALGVKHAALNVNLGDFMMPAPVEGDTIDFEFCGKKFYIRKSIVEKNDKKVKELTDAGIIITFILLNSRHWSTNVEESFWNVIKHPRYADEGTISAFDTVRAEGCEYYMAFVAFISERYTRADRKFGRAVGLIVGNEVNSGYVWCNAGEVPVDRYTYEYTTAVRIAWQVSLRYYSGMRVYVSLDQFWTGSNFDSEPLRYYGSKPVLEYLNKYCTNEGQVGWNIAYHPYPENLNFPDFWNDKTATEELDTYRITFKNIDVLAKFTYEPEYLYNGQRRRIILSEQGFNSHWTPESEVLQAMAYGVAYKKIMQIPEIDSFILHAHCDNKFEFGLNLGLWRRKKDGDGLDAPKPIYYVFKAIDKKDEKGVYHWERY